MTYLLYTLWNEKSGHARKQDIQFQIHAKENHKHFIYMLQVLTM